MTRPTPRKRAPRKRALVAALAVALVLLVADLGRPPVSQLSARALLAAIDLYQATISGRVGVRCRFEPSCSHYGEAVIRRYGALGGTLRSVGRILRCGPWTAAGTYDPPPA